MTPERLAELERLAKQATDPAEFSLFRQKAAHELRTACTVETIAALVAEVQRLQTELETAREWKRAEDW